VIVSTLGVLTGAGSREEEAGVRPGDSLQSFSVCYGDTTMPAKFGLQRGSERET